MSKSDEHDLYVDTQLGLFLARKKLFEKAIYYCNRVKDYEPKDVVQTEHEVNPDVFECLARSHHELGNVEEALAYIRKCRELKPNSVAFQKEESTLIYDLNHLEEAKVMFLKYLRMYSGTAFTFFSDKNGAVSLNLQDSLGESLSRFVMNNEEVFRVVHENILKEKMHDDRPLWKIRKELNECDILSIPEKKTSLRSPCLTARKEISNAIFYQTYFGKSWKDVRFLERLPKRSEYIIPNFLNSANQLKDLADNFAYVSKILHILRGRSPFYLKNTLKCPDIYKCKKMKEEYLYIKQYQTRRAIFLFLKKALELKEQGKLQALRKLVHTTMWNVVLCKTYRILPFKAELVDTIYQILGLAFCEDLINNYQSSKSLNGIQKLLKMLRMKDFSLKKLPDNVFEINRKDMADDTRGQEALKAEVSILELTAFHSIFRIEKTAKYHEIGCILLKANKFSEGLGYAQKTVDEATKANNNLWRLLGYILMIKIYAIQRKLEPLRTALNMAMSCARMLRSVNIWTFLSICESNLDVEFVKKRFASQGSSKILSNSSMSVGSSPDVLT